MLFRSIYVFTPSGDLKTLPVGATTLDFAFLIHSQIGYQCIGAKVNHKLEPLSHKLSSGDQVEILTSKKQRPKEDWLNIVITASARQKIKTALKEEKKQISEEGKEMLKRKFNSLKISWGSKNIDEFVRAYQCITAVDFYYKVAKGRIELKKLKPHAVEGDRIRFERNTPVEKQEETTHLVTSAPSSGDTVLIGDDKQKVDFSLAPCCNPIPGDEVFEIGRAHV